MAVTFKKSSRPKGVFSLTEPLTHWAARVSVCEGEGRDEEVLLPCETRNIIVLRTFWKDDCYFCLKYLFWNCWIWSLPDWGQEHFLWQKEDTFREAMPVLGVASKLRQPAVGSKPVHTALPIPNLGPTGTQHYSPKSLELTGAESSMLSCQLTLKSTCDFGERRALQGKTQELEDSKVSWKFYLHIWILRKC